MFRARKAAILHRRFRQNVTYGLVSQWIFYYCTDVILITPLVVGTIMGITRIWDAINDPLMGVLIDRRRFKNGEKLRPYLLFTPIIIGLLTLLMFLSPLKIPPPKLYTYFLFISLGIFSIHFKI